MEDWKNINQFIGANIREIMIRFIQARKHDPAVRKIIKEIVKEAQQESTISSGPYP